MLKQAMPETYLIINNKIVFDGHHWIPHYVTTETISCKNMWPQSRSVSHFGPCAIYDLLTQQSRQRLIRLAGPSLLSRVYCARARACVTLLSPNRNPAALNILVIILSTIHRSTWNYHRCVTLIRPFPFEWWVIQSVYVPVCANLVY